MCSLLSRVIHHINLIRDSSGRAKRSEVGSKEIKGNGEESCDLLGSLRSFRKRLLGRHSLCHLN